MIHVRAILLAASAIGWTLGMHNNASAGWFGNYVLAHGGCQSITVYGDILTTPRDNLSHRVISKEPLDVELFGKSVLQWSDDDIAAALSDYLACEAKIGIRTRPRLARFTADEYKKFETGLRGIIMMARNATAQRAAEQKARIEFEKARPENRPAQAVESARQRQEQLRQQAQRTPDATAPPETGAAANRGTLSEACLTELDNSRAVRSAGDNAKSSMIAALRNRGFTEAIRQASKRIEDEPVLPGDIRNPNDGYHRLYGKFSQQVHAILGTSVYGQYSREISWLGEIPPNCLPGFSEVIDAYIARLRVATEDARKQQKAAQERQEDQRRHWIEALADTGYKLVTLKDFLLDGRDLAAVKAKIAFEGTYGREGNLDVLYPSRIELLKAQRNVDTRIRAVLMADNASRKAREWMLECQQQRDCEGAAFKGYVTMCSIRNAFGVTREEPCLSIEDLAN